MAELAQDAAEPKIGAKTLFNALWFPLFFVFGFMIFYLVPFHAPTLYNVDVAVVGQQQATALSTAFDAKAPGAYEISAVADDAAARQAILDRNIVAAYDPATSTLFVAKADGQSLVQALQATFTPVAAQTSGAQLHVVDVAPTASGDQTGAGLFYILMVANIAGYITVMMLFQAVAIQGGRKLGVLAGFGLLASVIAFVFGVSLHVMPFNLWLLPVLFLLTQVVGWVTFGLAPFVKQYIPGAAMGLFVLLSIPSSGGAIPVQMVPGFFRFLHPVMPLGNAIDAARGILYFGGTGTLRPILVLAAWFLAGVGLVVLGGAKAKRAAAAEATDLEGELAAEAAEAVPVTESPVLIGHVRDAQGRPVTRGAVTITDHHGRQLGRASLSSAGIYTQSLEDVPPQYLTVVVVAPHFRSAAERVDAGREATTRLDFTLARAHGAQPERDTSADGAAAIGSAGVVPIE